MKAGVAACIPLAAAMPLLLLPAACNPAAESGNVAANVAAKPVAAPAHEPVPVNRTDPANAASAAPEAAVEVPEDAPGLAEMSPSRRRAYEQGYRDCSAGRYDPDPWPEAYRIGCGAAQEKAAGAGDR